MEFQLQQQDVIYLIYTGIAVGMLLFTTGLLQLLSRRENSSEAKSRRMRMVAQGKSTAELLAILKPPAKGGVLSSLPVVGNLPAQLRQAGWSIRPGQFVMICGLLFMGVFVAVLGLAGPLSALLAAFVAGFVAPIALVKAQRKKISDQLVHQLPDALDMMARGLRVGHPLNTSIGAVAREMPDPIGTEFGIVFDQVSYGDDLTDAFQEFSERVDLEDVNYLSASIGIQHGTGGDLASVIQVLSKTIRSRIAMRRKILAISSEGRLSALFLSLLPFVIFGFTSMSTPDYYGGVMDDPLFNPMAAAVVFFTILNMLILRKLVAFRI